MDKKPATGDVEMKDASKPEDKKVEKVEEKYDPYYEIKWHLVLLDKAVKEKDIKQCASIARSFKKVWKEISLKDVGQLFSYFLPSLFAKMNLPTYDSELVPVDLREKFHTNPDKAVKLASSTEAQNFFYCILVMKLIDEKWMDLAKDFVDFASA